MGIISKKILSRKSGSIIVDASLSLPVFIIAMAMLIGLIAKCAEEDNAYRELLRKSEFKSDAMAAVNAEWEECRSSVRLEHAKITLVYKPFVGACGSDSPLVFVFPKAGARYHLDGCMILTRSSTEEGDYVIMSEDEAAKNGYTPCMLCLGGKNVQNQ